MERKVLGKPGGCRPTWCERLSQAEWADVRGLGCSGGGREDLARRLAEAGVLVLLPLERPEGRGGRGLPGSLWSVVRRAWADSRGGGWGGRAPRVCRVESAGSGLCWVVAR